jgi:hypothetical protein
MAVVTKPEEDQIDAGARRASTAVLRDGPEVWENIKHALEEIVGTWSPYCHPLAAGSEGCISRITKNCIRLRRDSDAATPRVWIEIRYHPEAGIIKLHVPRRKAGRQLFRLVADDSGEKLQITTDGNPAAVLSLHDLAVAILTPISRHLGLSRLQPYGKRKSVGIEG